MNKSLSILFLVTLIASILSFGSKSASTDRLIDQLVQLNTAAGKDNNDIGLLVSQVSSAVKENAGNFAKFSDTLDSGCNQGKSLIEEMVSQLEASKIKSKAAANAAEKENSIIINDRDNYTAELKNTQDALSATEASIEKEVENFKKYGIESEQKLVIIKSLQDIITDEIISEQKNNSGTSFVQMRMESFNNKLVELKDLLVNSKEGIGVYGPLVTTLLSLAEGKGFADQKILEQIMGILNKLVENLRNFRDTQNNQGKENIKSLKAKAKEQEIQAQAISKIISGLNSNYSRNEKIMKESEEDINSLNAVIERKQNESSYFKSVCDYEANFAKTENEFNENFQEKLRKISATILG